MTRDYIPELCNAVVAAERRGDLTVVAQTDDLRALLTDHEELVRQVDLLTKAGDRAQAAELEAKRKVIRLEAELERLRRMETAVLGVTDCPCESGCVECTPAMSAAMEESEAAAEEGHQERVLAAFAAPPETIFDYDTPPPGLSDEAIGAAIAALPVTPAPEAWKERVLASIDAQELAALKWFHAQVFETFRLLEPRNDFERNLSLSRIKALLNDPRMRAVLPATRP